MLTNIPDGTELYMLAPKCPYEGAPEPRCLEAITLHHKWGQVLFTVASSDPRTPFRRLIHLKHLVNYYAKYMSPVGGFFMKDWNALELLFIADDELHQNRSLKDMEADRLEGKDFDEDYNCEWCAPRACCCGSRFHEEESEEEVDTLDVVTAIDRLKDIEKKMAKLMVLQKTLQSLVSIHSSTA
jgi:hypothetical protein